MPVGTCLNITQPYAEGAAYQYPNYAQWQAGIRSGQVASPTAYSTNVAMATGKAVSSVGLVQAVLSSASPASSAIATVSSAATKSATGSAQSSQSSAATASASSASSSTVPSTSDASAREVSGVLGLAAAGLLAAFA